MYPLDGSVKIRKGFMDWDAYEAFAAIDHDNPARYGLYAACTHCDLMEECAEYLPYCAIPQDAEKMAAICQEGGE